MCPVLKIICGGLCTVWGSGRFSMPCRWPLFCTGSGNVGQQLRSDQPNVECERTQFRRASTGCCNKAARTATHRHPVQKQEGTCQPHLRDPVLEPIHQPHRHGFSHVNSHGLQVVAQSCPQNQSTQTDAGRPRGPRWSYSHPSYKTQPTPCHTHIGSDMFFRPWHPPRHGQRQLCWRHWRGSWQQVLPGRHPSLLPSQRKSQ